MTRKTIVQLRLDIIAGLPNNTSGLITPAVLRGLLADLDQSLFADGVGLGCTVSTPITLLNVNTILTGLWNATQLNGNEAFTLSTAAGTITVPPGYAGFDYRAAMIITIDNIANNVAVVFMLGTNGVAGPQLAVITGQGNGNPVGANFAVPMEAVPSGTVFSLMYRVIGANQSINVVSASFSIAIVPTYS